MWVRFKVSWQDGMYIYEPGKVVNLPKDLAIRYCESGKAEPCKPPKWATEEVKQKNRHASVPSAKKRIKRKQTKVGRETSISDLANQMIGEE